ncbi:MAG TPA: cellulase family glycosylhydrolase [Steroidobacteraceae bacterium]|nr:cellulase family glycosylhydrolase [Steroidobacteraceae bacterium]
MSRRYSIAWRSLCAFFALACFAFAAQSQTLPTAQQVASNITVGWNLGNTLEAQCGETAWGNPVVTQAFINSVKAAGFNAIRIPAAWDCHSTNSVIDPAWMARVKQVVDYAIGQNMYVILNIHWDGGWLEEHPLYSYQVANNQKQTAFWTQIANTFKTYDQHLLFAGTNEVHADYNTPTAEHIEVQQSYNQTFVNAVRATGGNNASRTLVVQTYNTNAWHGLNYFSLPTDSASNRLMVEIHHYDPYDYTLNQSGSCLYWGAPYPSQGACTWAQEAYVDDLFNQVRAKWVAVGVPVIIGEYGVATRPNLNLESRAYYLRYMNEAAARFGLKTFYWDNGVLPSAGNGFALLNRTTGAIVDQAALNAIMLGAGVGNPNNSYTLTTAVSGSGTVTRSPNATTYSGGTVVTLTAAAASGNQFAGWTGDLSGTTNPQSVTMIANRNVTANFVPTGSGGTGSILREYWLNVTGGTVASLTGNAAYPASPTGSEQLTSLEGATNTGDNYGDRVRGYIHPLVTGSYTFWLASDDGGDLLLSTNDNPANATRIAYVSDWTGSREWTKYASQKSAAITLAAGQKYYVEVLHKEATGGDNFAVSWQGPGIAQAVIGGQFLSPFVPGGTSNYTLSVSKAGTGSGTVTSAPSGVNCGSACSAAYASGTSVTLTAAAAGGSTFAGWSGACSGTSTCTVSMTAARSVTATFNGSASFSLSVTKAGNGSGTVTSSPTGINCGSTCSANYSNNTSVTLTAAPASGSTFASWSGACTGTASCVLAMTAARNVIATFNTSGTSTPCANPVTFTNNSGNFNTTAAVCYRTSQNIAGWGCSNFDGRSVTVGGVARSCGALPLTKSADGYTYFSVTAGTYAWASLYVW